MEKITRYVRIRPAGSDAGPVELGKRALRKAFVEDDVSMYSAALALRALTALVPSCVLLVALLGPLGDPNLFDWLLSRAQPLLSQEAIKQASVVVEQSYEQARGGWFSLAAVAVAVWTISVGVRTLMTALNAASDAEEGRPVWKRYPLSVLLSVGIVLMLAGPAALMVAGSRAVGWLADRAGLGQEFAAAWTWVHWPAAILLLMLAVAVVYHLGADSNEPFHLVTPGAFLTVAGWLLLSAGLRYYLLNFADYSVTYGAIGAVLVLTYYFYASAAALLLGAEVNAVIRDASAKEGDGAPEGRTGDIPE